MKQTAAAVLLLLASLAALVLSRGVVLLLDGAAERWACFGLGMVAGWVTLALVLWIVVDYLANEGEIL
jgi:hypothetical protein